MLLSIKDNLEQTIQEICSTGTLEELRALTKLLNSHLDGAHLVLIPPSICRIIEECNRLSEEQLSAARKIRIKYHELAQLKNILTTYAEVTDNGIEPTLKENHIWQIPLKWIAEKGLSKTHLICEDLYDCELCSEAAKDYLNINSLNRLNVSLDPTPGGGGNTHRIFEMEAIKQKKISLCIVDSDRCSPSIDAPLGETASKCKGVSGHGIYELIVSEGREFENHLPVKLIDKVRNIWQGNLPSAKFAELELRHQHCWLFIDFKSGLRRRDIDKMPQDERAYWSAYCAIASYKDGCCPAQNCPAGLDETCKHVVIEPLGRSLLKDAVNYLNHASRQGSPKRYKEYLPSPNDAFWRNLGGKVAAYGISIKVNPL
jgi:hypothetical protein